MRENSPPLRVGDETNMKENDLIYEGGDGANMRENVIYEGWGWEKYERQ
jgi:hypothetical protein